MLNLIDLVNSVVVVITTHEWNSFYGKSTINHSSEPGTFPLPVHSLAKTMTGWNRVSSKSCRVSIGGVTDWVDDLRAFAISFAYGVVFDLLTMMVSKLLFGTVIHGERKITVT